jgi:hypothetical protein
VRAFKGPNVLFGEVFQTLQSFSNGKNIRCHVDLENEKFDSRRVRKNTGFIGRESQLIDE